MLESCCWAWVVCFGVGLGVLVSWMARPSWASVFLMVERELMMDW